MLAALTLSLTATPHGDATRLAAGGSAAQRTRLDAKTVADSSIEGSVTVMGGGGLVASIEVFDPSDSLVASTTSAPDGSYSVTELAADTYAVTARVPGSFYVGELYDGVPCEPDCNLAAGTAVVTMPATTTTGVDFVLAEGGRFAGTVTEATTGSPVGRGTVTVYDDTGAVVAGAPLEDGLYLTELLPPAGYFAVATSTFAPELYSEIPCPGLACQPTIDGDPITVSAGAITPDIDFTLELTTLGGIAGTLIDASTGGPLAEPSFVDIFDSSGSYLDSAVASGAFAYGDLAPGTYYLSTDTSVNAFPYFDELYDDLLCHPGGAFGPACSALGGTPVEVAGGSMTSGLVIELEPTLIFGDGFESGDLSAWGP